MLCCGSAISKVYLELMKMKTYFILKQAKKLNKENTFNSKLLSKYNLINFLLSFEVESEDNY
jgi:hypothetical protein